MPEKKVRWTKQQLGAIRARDSNVLVSASAGTGKTAVLSARCVDIVSDRRICPDVNSILVLTFTEAAAEQMRQRIAEQLRDAFLVNRDGHLRYQMMLLQGADISTIHSFCKRTITQYFYKLGLDPAFRVIDDDEQQLLKAEVLVRTIDWAWQQEHLAAGMNQLLSRRDLRTNDGFLSRIITISEFLDAVESRQKWFERATALIDAATGLGSELGQKQKRMIIVRMQEVIEQFRHCQRIYLDACLNGAWADICEDSFIRPVEQCLKPAMAGDWDGCVQQILSFKKQTVRKPAGADDESVAELVTAAIRKGQDTIEALKELAVINPDYLDRIGGAVGLQTRVLIELVRKFDQLYDRAKRSVNCLDFADLEHYALELLTDEASAGDRPSPSETALALRKKYRHIFVDEYQDINAVQKAILDRLSSGGNVFVVGDVKQSIYAWRGAEPRIFLEELKQASPVADAAPLGLRVDLNTNFRSRKAVPRLWWRYTYLISPGEMRKRGSRKSRQMMKVQVS